MTTTIPFTIDMTSTLGPIGWMAPSLAALEALLETLTSRERVAPPPTRDVADVAA